jgi:hypothetical protein
VKLEDLHWLEAEKLASVPGDVQAVRRWFGFVPIFHMPLFGGWKKYVVVAPAGSESSWFVGWIAGDTVGISRVLLHTPVRLLLGSGPAQFFALTDEGRQINLEIIGYGEIGVRSHLSKLPLL